MSVSGCDQNSNTCPVIWKELPEDGAAGPRRVYPAAPVGWGVRPAAPRDAGGAAAGASGSDYPRPQGRAAAPRTPTLELLHSV